MEYTVDNIEIFVLTHRANYLVQSIRSLLDQTVGVNKITILDNDSSDNTEDIIRNYPDRRVEYVRTFGFLGNFNRVKEIASKSFVMLFHDDDILHPNYLELVIQELNVDHEISMLTTRYVEFFDDKQPVFASDISHGKFLFETKKEFAKFMYYNEVIAYSTAVYKTECFLKIDVEYDVYSKFNDWPFMVKFADYGRIVLFEDPRLFLIRRHAGQDTWTNQNTPTIQQIIDWDKFFYDVLEIRRANHCDYESFMNRFPHFLLGKYKCFLSIDDKDQFSEKDLLNLVKKAGIGIREEVLDYNINDDLEIILVTYNRSHYLRRTLFQLFDVDSPVKNIDITILDNKSTDATDDVITEYKEKYSNVKHVINNRNIGGNANIARAFELSGKKYVWILCDDDFYDWSNWEEVRNAMFFNEDAICVSTYAIRNRESREDLLLQLTFVPGCIYRTENITNTVMRNVYENTSNSFPQLAVIIHLFNNLKSIYVVEKPIVENGWLKAIEDKELKLADASYYRGDNFDELFPTTKNFFWHSGFANSLVLLRDRDLARAAIEKARSNTALDINISNLGVLEHLVRISKLGNADENMVIFWNYYCRCGTSTRLTLLKLFFGPLCNARELDGLLYERSIQRGLPKWLIHIICWFIFKKKNRKHFRSKYE